MISLIYLLLNLSMYPYCDLQLNRTQTCFLFVNMFTLFVGIMLFLATYLDNISIRNGVASRSDTTQRDTISAILLLFNMLVLAAPILLATTLQGCKKLLKDCQHFAAP